MFAALLRAVVRVGQVGVEELHSIAQAVASPWDGVALVVRMIPSQLGVESSGRRGWSTPNPPLDSTQPLLPLLEP